MHHIARVDAAWLAGFIDADGSIGCYYHRHPAGPKNSHPWLSHKLRLQATNCNEATIKHLRSLTGYGTIVKDTKPQKNKWRTRYVWELPGQKALEVLDAIVPYMITKRPQAEVALRWSRVDWRRRGRGIPPGEWEKREAIRAELMKLNKRGH